MAVDYSFKPYDPRFPDIFLHEKDRLSKILTFPYRIEHLGSTAVENLGGKGIIDIYIVVNTEFIEQAKNQIASSGYDERPGEGSGTRFVFVRVADNQFGEKQRYHLHLCTTDSEDFHNNLLFCRYLQNHPDVAEDYAETKQKATAEAQQSKEVYMKVKGPFIEKIVQLAKEEIK